MANEPGPSVSLVEKAQSFISENKKVILIGAAAAIAVGGVAYYASTSSRSPSSDVEKAEKKEKKRGNKQGKKKKTVKDSDGPILEERKPKVEDDTDEEGMTDAQIAVLPVEERSNLAAGFKTKGNTAYSERKFNKAVKLYTRAISTSPTPQPVFYSNRAACYMNLVPPKYDLVIADCDEALKLDPNYIKALNRRATALEALERYPEALRDFTASTILEKFQNQASAQSVERVLKKYSSKMAAEIIAARTPRLPSFTFISAYFAAFRPRPLPELPESPSQGDQTLRLAFEALAASDYPHALSFVNESLEQGISTTEGKAEALNLRGTFKFLMADIEGSKADFLESIELHPSLTQTRVKIASVYMEQNDPKQAFECFEKAIAVNPNDPDIYYHRGQVLFIMSEFKEAAENYTKSTELDNDFVFSHIQLAVAQYKMERVAQSMATFRRTLQAFPKRAEPQNYYGELLLDQQRFEDAIDKFDRAYQLEQENHTSSKVPVNVLPLVNKALAVYQWKQDFSSAERYCNEALRIDPECDAAIATLAQFCLQQAKIEKAVELLSKQADLARTEPELTSALTYKYASEAQLEFMKNYPAMAAELRSIAGGLA